MTLSGRQRKWLRGQAHALQPVVHVGGKGLSDEVVAELDRALEVHELVKVRISFDRDERRRLAEEAAARTGADLAGLVGRVGILYRAKGAEEERRYRLPSS